MITEKFREVNIDFVAYLQLLGIEYSEIIKDSKNNPCFIYDDDFGKLLGIRKKFLYEDVTLNMLDFKHKRKELIILVKRL